ncbi:copper chaperone PCu(A)C [Corynebacterium yonathiae]|uniref:Copper chaperone PCu(A)C n=1 Tax=Corynebacterium yonathiae TaxID=2913504 RepID=A0A9X3RMX9_9CORY|nr:MULTISPECIES: copper chaperone PCu(A)C [Corynebacterium]MCZ9295308.1 copper chaperone PCu(A)C [Corynebacterium yonathiae]MDK2581979.1 copper chaperone PCu(A)C [Corynebacterium sp. BWA136]
MSKISNIALVGLTVAGLALAGCSPQNQNDSTESKADATTSAAEKSSSAAAEDLTFEDAVVRANEDKDMTAIFGTLVNHTDKDIAITGFSTSLNAKVNQIHETVDGKMQEMSSPLVVKAGESHELAPGGDHFMLMEMESHIAPGESLDLKVKLEGGEELDLGEIQTRSMPAGDEDYGDMEGHDMSHMEHGEMSHNKEGHDH